MRRFKKHETNQMLEEQQDDRPRPARASPSAVTLGGLYCRLEPLGFCHLEALYEASHAGREANRFAYMAEDAPSTKQEFSLWMKAATSSDDNLFFAIVENVSGRCEGRLALIRAQPAHGVIEIGAVYLGPAIARSRIGTEAIFLLVRHVFEELGYRRLEWKCNLLNEPSKAAARRIGFTFDGVFRQHMIVRGRNRDTAWFSLLDHDWPDRRDAIQDWLDPSNFDDRGCQRASLRRRPQSAGETMPLSQMT